MVNLTYNLYAAAAHHERARKPDGGQRRLR